MDIVQFLNRIVDDGIAAARRDYARPERQQKLNGSIAGFEACRQVGWSYNDGTVDLRDGLATLLDAAGTATRDAHATDHPDYWWFRCYELEVEWVCNCVSAALANSGLPVVIQPTLRGAMKAAEVIGVKQ